MPVFRHKPDNQKTCSDCGIANLIVAQSQSESEHVSFLKTSLESKYLLFFSLLDNPDFCKIEQVTLWIFEKNVTLQPIAMDNSESWSGLVVWKMLQLLLQNGLGHAEVIPCQAWKSS